MKLRLDHLLDRDHAAELRDLADPAEIHRHAMLDDARDRHVVAVRGGQARDRGTGRFACLPGNGGDDNLARSGALQARQHLGRGAVGNDRADVALRGRELRQVCERAGVAGHELRVLRHVGDDIDPGRLHGLDPFGLERTDILDEDHSGAALVGHPRRLAGLCQQIRIRDDRIERQPSDAHVAHVVAHLAAGSDKPFDSGVPGGLDQGERVIARQNAHAGERQRGLSLRGVRNDDDAGLADLGCDGFVRLAVAGDRDRSDRAERTCQKSELPARQDPVPHVFTPSDNRLPPTWLVGLFQTRNVDRDALLAD